MSKVDDIFMAKRAIEDLQKICSHYDNCADCPVFKTGVCDDSFPSMWDTSPMFEEKR